MQELIPLSNQSGMPSHQVYMQQQWRSSRMVDIRAVRVPLKRFRAATIEMVMMI